MAICGGFPLALYRALHSNTGLEMGADFSDIDVFTTYELSDADATELLETLRRQQHVTDVIATVDHGDELISSLPGHGIKSTWTFGIRIPCDTPRYATVQIITVNQTLLERFPVIPFWKKVVDQFDISICKMCMPDADSDPIPLDESVKQDVQAARFTYTVRSAEDPKRMSRRIAKYMGRGYQLTSLQLSSQMHLDVTGATIRYNRSNA